MATEPRRREAVHDIGIPLEEETLPPAELGSPPIPDELTGRASKTEDDLESLFENRTEEHVTDGFRGGSGDEPEPDGPPPDLDAPAQPSD